MLTGDLFAALSCGSTDLSVLRGLSLLRTEPPLMSGAMHRQSKLGPRTEPKKGQVFHSLPRSGPSGASLEPYWPQVPLAVTVSGLFATYAFLVHFNRFGDM